MATNIRKLAHQMLDELKEEELSEAIKAIRSIKNQNVQATRNKGFPADKPTESELEAIKQSRREFANDEYYSHKEVFKEEDYV